MRSVTSNRTETESPDECPKDIEYIWVYEPSSPWFSAVVDLERSFFGGGISEAPPESAEGLTALLSIGARFLLQIVEDSLDGCIELIEVERLIVTSPSLFPTGSPTRRLLNSGVLGRLRSEDLLVYGWMGSTYRAMELANHLHELGAKRIVGFVLCSDKRATKRYDRIASKTDRIPALYGECDAHWIYVLRQN